MRLDKLLNEVDLFDRPADARKIDIANVTDDTAEVVAGSLFCCVVGSRRDGHDLAKEAVAKGAVALLVEHELPDIDVAQARVSDVRASIAAVAAAFYDHPDKHLRVVGITGTNGKTTTAHMLAAMLRRHNWITGVIGTLDGGYTSPPAIHLQRRLAEMRARKHHAVVMEVSSHALVQHRVDAIRFRAAVFTNLTQDHLDYHGSMNAYFEAKSALFDPGRAERAIINVDDSWGRQLHERVALPVHPYSLSDAHELNVGPSGSTFTWHGARVSLPLIGTFNVYNALAAATTAKALGVPVDVIVQALDVMEPVSGRVERIDRGQSYTVLVDFAHTPDGLENVLNVGRKAADQRKGRLIVVFGCGGDRDKEKRPLMGLIAEQLAHHVVVSTDNPRSEDPAKIVDQVLSGMQHPERAHVELDRAAAIQMAVDHAGDADVLVIAGKGHESTQEANGVKTPFDDRLVAAHAIETRRAGELKRSADGIDERPA